MSKTICQEILFKNTTAHDLYELYMDSKKHTTATAAPAKISKKEGGKYSVHGGYITGRNLQLIEDKLIVQTWRAQGWKESDPDSTFIINLEQKGNDVLLFATHANVPNAHEESISKGWHNHYWEPWKKYLAGNPIKQSPSM
jgi:activator of HSP90 ATPase